MSASSICLSLAANSFKVPLLELYTKRSKIIFFKIWYICLIKSNSPCSTRSSIFSLSIRFLKKSKKSEELSYLSLRKTLFSSQTFLKIFFGTNHSTSCTMSNSMYLSFSFLWRGISYFFEDSGLKEYWYSLYWVRKGKYSLEIVVQSQSRGDGTGGIGSKKLYPRPWAIQDSFLL